MEPTDNQFTLSRSMLVSLLDALGYPNPDDPGDPNNPWGPYGPGGPVSSRFREALSWAMLNPQPLPPVNGPSPDPWRSMAASRLTAGPQPEPWHSMLTALTARMVIDGAVARIRGAENAGMDEQSERVYNSVRASIREFVDDWCGTPPRRWPRPWPWPLTMNGYTPDPVDLIAAGAQFHLAAAAVDEGTLQEEFGAAANRLFETGLGMLSAG